MAYKSVFRFVFVFFSFKSLFILNSSLICYITSFTIDPNPPGPIDTNSSNFHPQTLYLKWARSENSSYVNMYQITIDWYTLESSSTSLFWSRYLEPGRNYTVQIVAICWYYNSYRKWSPAYNGVIHTLRMCFVIIIHVILKLTFLFDILFIHLTNLVGF